MAASERSARARQRALHMREKEGKLLVIATQIQRLFTRCTGQRARELAVQILKRWADQPGMPEDGTVRSLVKELLGRTPRDERSSGSALGRAGTAVLAGGVKQGGAQAGGSRQVGANPESAGSAGPSFARTNAQIQQDQLVASNPRLQSLAQPRRSAQRTGSMWRDIAIFQQREQVEEIAREKRLEAEQAKLWRKQLDEQVRHAKRVEANERKRDVDYAREKDQELASWKLGEARKLEVRRAKAQAEAREQAKQRADNLVRRQAEDRARALEDARMMQVLKRQQAEDAARDQAVFDKLKRDAELSAAENKQLLKRKAKQRELEAAEDEQRLREFEIRETAKEAQRQKVLADMAARIKAKMAQGAQAVQQGRDRENADMRRVELEEERYKQHQAAEDARKKRAALARAKQCRDSMQEQVRERRKAKLREDEEDRRLATALKAQNDAADAAEQRKQQEKQRQALNHSRWLQEQIAARASATTGVDVDVSQREIDLNKSLLRQMAGEE